MNGGAPQRFPALGSMFPICLGSATLDLHRQIRLFKASGEGP